MEFRMIEERSSWTTSVVGLVTVDGEAIPVSCPSEYLIVDARAWMERQERKHREMSAENDDDPVFAKDMLAIASSLSKLLEAGTYVETEDLWPQLRQRAELPIWAVEEGSERAYARMLVEFGEKPAPVLRELDFLLRVSGTQKTLWLSHELANIERYARPFTSKVLARRIITMAAGGRYQ